MNIPKEVLEIAENIKNMKIRGAGRIARSAANALKIASEKYSGNALEEYISYIKAVANILLNTRPTAVSLPNAINFVISRLMRKKNYISSVEEARSVVESAASEFITRSKEALKLIGAIGARRIENNDTILTHCNSSAALSVIIKAYEEGKDIRVFATETRPKFQGIITAKTLASKGIDVTLIPDSAVRLIMKKVDKVIVGADAVAANGAVVNKIGTSQIALAAHEARVRVFVAAETYKFSPATVTGELVVIEEREPNEVVSKTFLEEHPKIKVRNPAFDVTPADYIDAIITEKGIIPPQAAILILKEEYGWVISDYLLKISPSEEEGETTK